MNLVKSTLRLTSIRNLGKSAAILHGNVAALTKSPESPFISAQFRRFSARTTSITVPDNHAYIIERDGKYWQTLYAGNYELTAAADRIAFVQSLEEKTIEVTAGSVHTEDVVFISGLNGYLSVQIVDPYLASYGCKSRDLISEIAKLAESVLDEKIRKIVVKDIINNLPLTTTKPSKTQIFHEQLGAMFQEKSLLDKMNKISEEKWGLRCLRFKQTGVSMPEKMFKDVIWRAAEVEWRKRAVAILSEAKSRADGLVGMIEGGENEGAKIIDRAKEEGTLILAAVESQFKPIEDIYEGGPKW